MGLLIPHQLRGGAFHHLTLTYYRTSNGLILTKLPAIDIFIIYCNQSKQGEGLNITLLNTGQSRSGGKVKGPVIRIFCKQKSRFKQTLPI